LEKIVRKPQGVDFFDSHCRLNKPNLQQKEC